MTVVVSMLWANAHAAVSNVTFGTGTGIGRFQGNASIDVASSCLSSAGWRASTDPYVYNPPNTCTAKLRSAQVTVDPGTANAELLDFSGLLSGTNTVKGVNVVDGHLAGFDTYSIGALAIATGPHAGNWWLQFDSGTGHGAGPAFPSIDPAVLYFSTDCLVGCATPATWRIEEITAITPVPEPSPWNLLFAAGLGGLLLLRDRARSTRRRAARA